MGSRFWFFTRLNLRNRQSRRAASLLGVIVFLFTLATILIYSATLTASQRATKYLGEADTLIIVSIDPQAQMVTAGEFNQYAPNAYDYKISAVLPFSQNQPANVISYEEYKKVPRSWYRLDKGRWPATPGEVVLTTVGPWDTSKDVLEAFDKHATFKVVGTVKPVFSDTPTIIAFPNTLGDTFKLTQAAYPVSYTVFYYGDNGEVGFQELIKDVKRYYADTGQDEALAEQPSSTERRANLLSGVYQPIIFKTAFGFTLPALVATVGVALIAYRQLKKWRDDNLPKMVKLGIPSRLSGSASVLAGIIHQVLATLSGAVAGLLLALVLRPFLPMFTHQPVSPLRVPYQYWLLVLGVVALQLVRVKRVGSVRQKSSALDTSRLKLAEIAGKTARVWRRNWVLIALSTLGIGAYIAMTTDTPNRLTIAIILTMVGVLTCIPPLLDLLTVRAFKLGPTELARRLIRSEHSRYKTVAIVIAAIIALPVATANFASIHMALVARSTLSLVPKGTLEINNEKRNVDEALVAQIQQYIGAKPAIQKWIPADENGIGIATTKGVLSAFKSVEQAQSYLQHPLTPEQIEALKHGVLIYGKTSPSQIELKDGNNKPLGQVPAAEVQAAPEIQNREYGMMLLSTATKLIPNMDTKTPNMYVFNGLNEQQESRIDSAPIALGFNSQILYRYRPAVVHLPPNTVLIALAVTTVLVLLVLYALARLEADNLTKIARSAHIIGMRNTWLYRLVLTVLATPTLIGLILGWIIGCIPVLLWATFAKPGLPATISYPLLAVTIIATTIALATTATITIKKVHQ